MDPWGNFPDSSGVTPGVKKIFTLAASLCWHYASSHRHSGSSPSPPSRTLGLQEPLQSPQIISSQGDLLYCSWQILK